jgi:antirestriction protein
VRTAEAEAFLRAVASTCGTRVRPMRQGMRLWRAQLDHRYEAYRGWEVAVPCAPDRMKPLRDSAIEERANPKGIPCLYLSTTERAAMSEMRPWVGSMVSVAQFETVRPLIIVDCSVLHDQYFKLAFLDRKIGEEVSPDKVEEIVWASIDRAFAEPVTRSDNVAEYAATQIIAELFLSEGYHGVAYKSAFGEDAYSVASFDLDSAAYVDAKLFEVKGVDFQFEELDRPVPQGDC